MATTFGRRKTGFGDAGDLTKVPWPVYKGISTDLYTRRRRDLEWALGVLLIYKDLFIDRLGASHPLVKAILARIQSQSLYHHPRLN